MSKNIFKDNPNLPEAFITSNGEVFYQKHDAEVEAKKLADKKIEHVINPSQKVAVSEPFVQVEENNEGSTELEFTAEIDTDEIKAMTVEAAVSFALETDREKAKELFEAAFKTEGTDTPTGVRNDENRPNVIIVDDVDNDDEKGSEESAKPWLTENLVTNSDPKVNEPVTEVKLTGKQQAQKDYTDKFGEIPAEDFTTKQLLAAVANGEKLVAEINND